MLTFTTPARSTSDRADKEAWDVVAENPKVFRLAAVPIATRWRGKYNCYRALEVMFADVFSRAACIATMQNSFESTLSDVNDASMRPSQPRKNYSAVAKEPSVPIRQCCLRIRSFLRVEREIDRWKSRVFRRVLRLRLAFGSFQELRLRGHASRFV